MSETYQRLAQDLCTTDDVHGVALPTDKGQLKAWVSLLPRANPKETASMLYSGLVKSRAVKMSGSARYSLLEELREAAIDSIAWLERQFVGGTLPLAKDRYAFAQLAINLQIVLADSYRLASFEICAPAGAIPMFKTSQINAALARSQWHYLQALHLNWKLYRSCPKGVWLSMHRVYQFAKHINLEGKDVEDPILSKLVQIEHIYNEASLASLMNPLAFPQTGQESLKTLAASFAPHCSIGSHSVTEKSVKLPIDADLPVNSELPENEVLFFTFSALLKDIETLSYDNKDENFNVSITKGQYLSMPVAVLLKVKRSLGIALDRGHIRQFEPYPIETIVGFNNLHFFVAGQIDFNDYVQQLSQMSGHGLNMSADWMNINADTSSHITMPAAALDHSLGGYCIHWPIHPSLRVRIGEVIGLNIQSPDAVPDWMVAVIRWLRYEQDGTVVAGLELISRRCHSVALRIYQNKQPGSLMRGLELEPLEDNLPRRFLMSGRLDGVQQQVEVLYSYEPYRFGTSRVSEKFDSQGISLASNMDYSLLPVL